MLVLISPQIESCVGSKARDKIYGGKIWECLLGHLGAHCKVSELDLGIKEPGGLREDIPSWGNNVKTCVGVGCRLGTMV